MAASVLKQLRNAVGLAALTAAAASSASAFVLDGRETGTEYATADVFAVDFLLTGVNLSFDTTDGTADGDITISGGTLKIGRVGTTGDIFAILNVPISVVDNVVGPDATGSPTATAGSGWLPGTTGAPKHPLDKLVKSDKFEFTLPVGGGNAPVNIDYINDNLIAKEPPPAGTGAAGAFAPVVDDGAGSVVAASTSLVYNLTGKDFTGGGAGTGDARIGDNSGFYGTVVDGKPNPSASPDPLDFTKNPSGLAPPSDWIQAVQYEIQFDGTKFPTGAPFGAAALISPSIHASPNKLNGDNVVNVVCLQIVGGPQTGCVPSSSPPPPPPPGSPGISEPGTLGAFSVGLLALAWWRRRRAV